MKANVLVNLLLVRFRFKQPPGECAPRELKSVRE